MTERERILLDRIGELEQERDEIRQRMHIQIQRLVIERDFLRAQAPGQWGDAKDTIVSVVRLEGKVGRIQMDIITNPDLSPVKNFGLAGKLAGKEITRLMWDLISR